MNRRFVRGDHLACALGLSADSVPSVVRFRHGRCRGNRVWMRPGDRSARARRGTRGRRVTTRRGNGYGACRPVEASRVSRRGGTGRNSGSVNTRGAIASAMGLGRTVRPPGLRRARMERSARSCPISEQGARLRSAHVTSGSNTTGVVFLRRCARRVRVAQSGEARRRLERRRRGDMGRDTGRRRSRVLDDGHRVPASVGGHRRIRRRGMGRLPGARIGRQGAGPDASEIENRMGRWTLVRSFGRALGPVRRERLGGAGGEGARPELRRGGYCGRGKRPGGHRGQRLPTVERRSAVDVVGESCRGCRRRLPGQHPATLTARGSRASVPGSALRAKPVFS